MKIQDLKRKNLIFGLFLDTDLDYESNKGKFYNNVKRKSPNRKFVFINDPRIGDILFQEGNPAFKIRTLNNSLHFENDERKEDFIKDTIELIDMHHEVFNNESIMRMGFVQNFEVLNPKKMFMQETFFKNLPNENTKSINFHINYTKHINVRNVNVNVTIIHDLQSNMINGTLDINLGKDDDPNLKFDNAKEIFDILEKYYTGEFIDDFFN
jgi:hypothetical protein